MTAATRQILGSATYDPYKITPLKYLVIHTIERAFTVPADDAAFRTAEVVRRRYMSVRTGSAGPSRNHFPPELAEDWTALTVDGSHIDVDLQPQLLCHTFNLSDCP